MSDLIDKISKLLAQAERTTGPEADAFMEKAQELASVAQIDLAVARSRTEKREARSKPEKRNVKVNDYSRRNNRARFVDLFLAIAAVNDAECTIGGTNTYVFPIGFPEDLDVIEALYASLSVQMEAAASAALKRGDHKRTQWDPRLGREVTYSTVDGRIWRANFYDGFISRITSRLWDARRRAERAAGLDDPETSSSTELALRDKRQEVHEAAKENEAEWRRQTGRGLGSYKGAEPPARYADSAQEAGARAAQSARLGGEDDRTLGAGGRRALGGAS